MKAHEMDPWVADMETGDAMGGCRFSQMEKPGRALTCPNLSSNSGPQIRSGYHAPLLGLSFLSC